MGKIFDTWGDAVRDLRFLHLGLQGFILYQFSGPKMKIVEEGEEEAVEVVVEVLKGLWSLWTVNSVF